MASVPRMSRWWFDRADYDLLDAVNAVLERKEPPRHVRKLFDRDLHPRGIKELTAPRDLRVAFAVLHLLDSLEVGKADDRLAALRSLRDEVLAAAPAELRINTARVLVQTMKELLRARGEPGRQLELAHEFRAAARGRPRQVRALLRRHHLVEMPEAWNQLAFDDHVHDAHTKGRKSASHLVLDAWLKGIRRLTVVYYHHVPPEAARELLEAAAIMGVAVRIGVEFAVRFRGRWVQLVWVPRGFHDAGDFLAFLAAPAVRALQEEGRRAAEVQSRCVFALLEAFDRRHRPVVEAELGVDLEGIDPEAFRTFVGTGQPSLLHLGEFLHGRVREAFEVRLAAWRAEGTPAEGPVRAERQARLDRMRALDSETLVDRFLRPAANPELPDPHLPQDDPDDPELLRLDAPALLRRLEALPAGFRLTLNCSGLTVDDVAELLHQTRGAVTHLEIYNLKDQAAGRGGAAAAIDALRHAVNDPNAMHLKRLLRERAAALAADGDPEGAERLLAVQRDLPILRAAYDHTPLKARLGSDSTGRSHRTPGMGLVVCETLPPGGRRFVRRTLGRTRALLPIRVTAHRVDTSPASIGDPMDGSPARRAGDEAAPPARGVRREWVIDGFRHAAPNEGNLATLGWLHEPETDRLSLDPPPPPAPPRRAWRHLDSGLQNALKILLGFLPAFATFALTKDWWVLAYLGAPLWFAITGLRNVLQSVLGGGGLRRSSLLAWHDYVNWSRVADSMLFTGFSVPLLDWLVKTVLLDRTLGITTSTAPVALYAAIGTANGLYLAAHNALRALPRAAVVGNLFRSLLSIPIAVALNAALAALLPGLGVASPQAELQKWSAVIAKFASDLVAGFIEGIADRVQNVRLRLHDYRSKLRGFFDVYARLELLLPETDVAELLASPKRLLRTVREEAADLEKALLLHALDLLYFWMYQPRARTAFRRVLPRLSPEERFVLLRMQGVLAREREVGELLLHGAAGRRFARALAFYLARAPEYLRAMRRLEIRFGTPQTAPPVPTRR